jgi:hypothetical protein
VRTERTSLARIAAVACACLLAGNLAPVGHYELAGHEVCGDHGELVHTGAGHDDHGSEHHPGDDSEHEHCAPGTFALTTATLHVRAPIAEPMRQELVTAAAAPAEAPLRASARYRLAPKGSPPA